jgi:tripartite-type tricarboxylate transporter receptor subunit TctC
MAMQMSFRYATMTLFAAVAFGNAAAGQAEDAFPSRTVKLVVPAAGGSTTDVLARIMADQLSRTWGKPVVVENVSSGRHGGARHPVPPAGASGLGDGR